MATETKKFVVTNAAEAEEAEKAAAAFRLAARNEKFGPLRKVVNTDTFDATAAGLQKIIEAETFDDDPSTLLALQNTVMSMRHLKSQSAVEAAS